ncbi:outer membrane biogenesis protein BamB [Caulifigura coniformis]|uniref:Outer membrane biogenesis protein BamB n=1 Tax=Caulifigura coniformis TaxID=2527983 RepID=A0A517SMH7_9PLAN|nr:PQQ-binding-like beta-propeller repeat protein [Caulifigura coniformis]QDT57334.1 outer membrane biogenesis protein BamB [Caulifigura coniformis]
MNALKHFGQAVAAITVASVVHSATAAAPDTWPTFRGPGRTAVSPDTNLLEKWPEDGPPLVWRTTGVGRGFSSLAIVDGKVYTFGDTLSEGAPDDSEYLQCFDQKTGKRLWLHKTTPLWTGQKNIGWQSPRSTPTVDGDRVYVLSPAGVLVACKSADGTEIFRVDLVGQYGGKKADSWGYSESPLIDGEKVIVTPGGESTTMVAFDKKTGKEIWKNVREGDIGAGHASVVTSDIGGTKVYVTTTGSGALGVRAEDGKVLWSYPIEKTTAVIPTPIIRGDLVFFAMGYNTGGGALLKQVPQANKDVKIEPVYDLKPELKNKHGGVVLVGDYLYADRDDKGLPYCAEFMTGKIVWPEKRGSGKKSAAIAAADGHLYIRYQDGVMVLAKADPSGYQEVGSFTPPGSGERSSWAHPVIVDGMLFIRENDSIMCYDVRDKSSGSSAASQ